MNADGRTDMLRDEELLIRRWLDAPGADVYRIWSERGHIMRWWGPKDFTCTHFEMDFRPGGRWRARIVSDAYGEGWMRGEYRAIEPGRRIAFSFMWENGDDQPGVLTEVVVTFEERDGRTLQSMHQAPFLTVESRDSHLSGWSECFDNEAAYLAGTRAG